ncbi:hypothetical protein POM88_054477 [Heracleum sosnowskyi]|uniref:Replication factor A C-terminal domain-containing protein n=1 Tax=Heracleum sosnowskyi TaxID=360622 RepID=A0AAD8GNP8_9APIA|nr:hypothetical protein POM88_054477 [Heracleum sosnowskyi]
MAPQLSFLSSLSTQSDSYTIRVRVTRIWESINKRNNQVMFTNVIFVDEEDSHMLATVRNNQKDAFITVDRDLSINFYYKTKIEKVPDNVIIPRYKFELKEIEDVQNYVGDVKCFIDVIGMVISYGHMEARSNGASKMDVITTNARNKKVSVSLWEEKALEFRDSLAAVGKGAVFVVIAGLMAKKFSDRVFLSSSSFSKRFVNTEENELHNLTIEEILQATLPDGTTFLRRTCEATIIGIVEAEGWFYNCCPRCARKVRAIEEIYYCENCAKETNDFKPRYKLIVRAQDTSGATTFTLFNKEAEHLISVPVENVISQLTEESTLTDIPPLVKNVVGKKCAFEIKINAYNTDRGYEEYTVYRLKECPDIVAEEHDKQMEGTANKKPRTT